MKILKFFSYFFLLAFIINVAGFFFFKNWSVVIYGLYGQSLSYIGIIILIIYGYKALTATLILTDNKHWLNFAKVDAVAGILISIIAIAFFIKGWDSYYQSKRILGLEILLLIPYYKFLLSYEKKQAD